jgi:hypothetical protein
MSPDRSSAACRVLSAPVAVVVAVCAAATAGDVAADGCRLGDGSAHLCGGGCPRLDHGGDGGGVVADPGGHVGELLDRMGGRAAGRLDRGDACGDLIGGIRGLLRQFLDFSGHDREVLAQFTGPGRFDGGIEDEQIRCPVMLVISSTTAPISAPAHCGATGRTSPQLLANRTPRRPQEVRLPRSTGSLTLAWPVVNPFSDHRVVLPAACHRPPTQLPTFVEIQLACCGRQRALDQMAL